MIRTVAQFAQMAAWHVSTTETDNRGSMQTVLLGRVLLNYCGIQTLSLLLHEWGHIPFLLG